MRLFDPFTDLADLRRELDRAFEFLRGQHPARNVFLPGREPRLYPLLNIRETADALHVEALAPGIDPDSLQISVLRDQLTISGEKRRLENDVKPEDYHRSERSTGRFVRTVTLPAEVNSDAVSAEYRAGILHIALPKAEQAKPRRIAVSVA